MEVLSPPLRLDGGLGLVRQIDSATPGTLRLVADGPGGPVQFQLDALSDEVVRLRVAPDGLAMPEDSRYSHDPDATWSGPTSWRVLDTEAAVTATTAELTIRIERAWPRLVVTNAEGAVLLDTRGLSWHDGHIVHKTVLQPADRLLGLGDKAMALDRRGHRYEMWNTDAFKYQRGSDPLYKSVPFVLRIGEEASVGLFYDDSHRTHVNLGADAADRMIFASPWQVLDLTVISAPNPMGIVQRFARLTGRTPMLPKWSLGYHQCRYSYMNEGEVREVAQQFRQREIPCDTLYFDIHYMDGFRVFTWDCERFPDPAKLLADLDRDGFRSVVIIDPGVKADDPDYAVYQSGETIDAYVRYPDADGEPGEVAKGEVWPGLCAFPDYTRADVREWWGRLHTELVTQGVDGIWNDMNEPALFEVAHVEGSMAAEEAVGTLPEHALHAMDGRGGTHAEAHNIYGMQMQRATFEGLLELRPDARPFTITRAAYAGSQRFGTGWTGDNTASWDHLRLAVQTCLSLGVSGMPFTGADVGGFVGHPTGELLARWTQVGALTPLFRNHSAVDTTRQEPWPPFFFLSVKRNFNDVGTCLEGGVRTHAPASAE
ncbi:MAG: TIM-barrel domain-containing protein [Bacteroidota bacterium]